MPRANLNTQLLALQELRARGDEGGEWEGHHGQVQRSIGDVFARGRSPCRRP